MIADVARTIAQATGAIVAPTLAFTLLFVSACSPEGSSQWPAEVKRNCAKGFNVLLITLDTTRADRLGSYGYDKATTPNLDALAARGRRGP